MKATLTIERLTEIIKYLEENPQEICDPYPQYDKRIYEILESLDTDQDYMENHKTAEEKPVDAMTLDDIRAMFTFILRGERFCDGCIAQNIEDGTILKLAKRELELLTEA